MEKAFEVMQKMKSKRIQLLFFLEKQLVVDLYKAMGEPIDFALDEEEDNGIEEEEDVGTSINYKEKKKYVMK
jgi:hypothetical protein